ncbi:MAG TPA: hypothetical protein VKP69_10175 [Isosphaeraceae bacterium]|nr:hypothetical protein [Isosphaeraceae bacterium]
MTMDSRGWQVQLGTRRVIIIPPLRQDLARPRGTGQGRARSSSVAESPPRMITRASEGRLACSATTTWTVAWSD